MESILSSPLELAASLKRLMADDSGQVDLEPDEIQQIAQEIDRAPGSSVVQKQSSIFMPKGEGKSGNVKVRPITPPAPLHLNEDDDGSVVDSVADNEPDLSDRFTEAQGSQSGKNEERSSLAADFLAYKDWTSNQIRAIQTDLINIRKAIEGLSARTSVSVPLSGRLSPTRRSGGNVSTIVSPVTSKPRPSSDIDHIVTEIVGGWGPYPSLGVVRRGKISTLAKATGLDLSKIDFLPSEWNATSVLKKIKAIFPGEP